MNQQVEYILKQCWTAFKNNNRTLFYRSLWIWGANEFKHKDIKNTITEDVTIYYPNNLFQLRAFHAFQPSLSEETLQEMNFHNLRLYVEEYFSFDKKARQVSSCLKKALEIKNFEKIKKYFKELVSLNARIYAYEYLISSLGMNLYKDLSLSEQKFFNSWKNNDLNGDFPVYSDFFKFLKDYFKFEIPVNEISLYLTVDDVINLLEKLYSVNEILEKIKARTKGFLLLNLKNNYNVIICDFDKVQKVRSYFEFIQSQHMVSSSLVKGTSTLPLNNKIRGYCVVIKNNYDIPKDYFNKILVCPILTATDIQKYEDVKAIVSDNGGFLSHAAIYSREVHKPCLIGCEVATKIFNTGDLIEIDFKKETVYKI